MANKKLSRIKEICTDDCTQLQECGLFTCKDVLSKNVLELMNINHSYEKSLRLFKKVSKNVSPKASTAFQMMIQHEKRFLPTSLSSLDDILHGGLPAGTITEITGPPGCGKTQFCIMMSAVTVLRNDADDEHIVYIDTENAFSAKRFLEVVDCKINSNQQNRNVSHVASKVIVYIESNCESLLERLELLEDVIICKNVRLIILDSIASLARKEFGHHAMIADRNQMLMKQATKLKYYAEMFNIPVLVTNQISTQVNKEFANDTCVTAALGNTWAHAVNSRLMVKFVNDHVREMIIAKSPIAPPARFYYKIDASGIVLIHGI